MSYYGPNEQASKKQRMDDRRGDDIENLSNQENIMPRHQNRGGGRGGGGGGGGRDHVGGNFRGYGGDRGGYGYHGGSDEARGGSYGPRDHGRGYDRYDSSARGGGRPRGDVGGNFRHGGQRNDRSHSGRDEEGGGDSDRYDRQYGRSVARGGGGHHGSSGGGGRGRGGHGGRFEASSRVGRGRGHNGAASASRGERQAAAPTGKTTALTNVLLAEPTPNFKFYRYTVEALDRDGNQIGSSSRRNQLLNLAIFGKLLKDMTSGEKESLRRKMFFCGNFFFSSSPVPGLDNLPLDLLDGTDSDLDTTTVQRVQCFSTPNDLQTISQAAHASKNEVSMDFRCSDCTTSFLDFNGVKLHCQATGHSPVTNDQDTKPASIGVFLQYANTIVQRAMGERMARWGRHYVDPQSFVTPRNNRGQEMGVHVFQAYHVEFNVGRPEPEGPPKLMLTVDLTAKLIRTQGILHALCENKDPNNYRFSEEEKRKARQFWIGEQVISKLDKTAYSIHDLVFESPDSLAVGNLKMSHTKYYQERKNYTLEFAAAAPMIAVLGRNKQIIHLPAEIVCANELDEELRSQLPKITSFKPDCRNDAIETVKKFLIPGAHKSKGKSALLPALGIVLSDERLKVQAEVLPTPVILSAAGFRVNMPPGKSNWVPQIARANFDVQPNEAVDLNTIVVHHKNIEWKSTYKSVARMVNNYNATFRFPDHPHTVLEVEDDQERHWGSVATHFSSTAVLPANVFVLDFTKPRKNVDIAYPVVKKMFASGGILSQFINFKNCDHGNPKNEKRSKIVLSAVARQILNKTGVAIWWTEVPRSLPLPAIFVGVDVFHAPRTYDPQTRSRVARNSVAAIVVRVIRDHSSRAKIECYSQTFKRDAGQEFQLGAAMEQTLRNAMKSLNLSAPASCVVWRDGVGDTSIASTASQELPALRQAIGSNVPVAMIVCQKRIATKFFDVTGGGRAAGMPAGTLVQSCSDLNYPTFYINGTAPPYATAKPVRFLIAQRDEALANMSIADLTWSQMAEYPNWTGTIKVPAVCQLAHLLAEHAGNFDDSGESIDHAKFANHLYFL